MTGLSGSSVIDHAEVVRRLGVEASPLMLQLADPCALPPCRKRLHAIRGRAASTISLADLQLGLSGEHVRVRLEVQRGLDHMSRRMQVDKPAIWSSQKRDHVRRTRKAGKSVKCKTARSVHGLSGSLAPSLVRVV